jgi:isoquinoline 1-oxidoreductase beta subunit
MVGQTLTELKPVRSEGSSNVGPRMDLDRRTFLQVLGSGLLITVVEAPTQAQPSGDRVSGTILARLYLNEDGTFTALSGKVEEGQGPRTELTEAAAEELGVALDQVHLIMADTDQVPDDGITAGSRTTPINVPEMRRAAAAARELLQQLAAERWRVDATMLKVEDGVIQNPSTGQTMSYRDLVRTRDVVPALRRRIPSDVALRPVEQWKVLGKPTARPNVRDLVTGTHRYPSDIVRPQMLYGAVLRPPSFGAELKSIDLTAVEAMDEVKIVRDGSFVGFAAPSSFLAARAARAAAAAARWQEKPQEVSHRTVHSYLIDHAERERARPDERGSVEDGMAQAQKTLAASYTLAYIQHAPLEPRAAVAEWNGNKLTVWVGCDGPFRARSHLSEELGVPSESIRVIVPDMGGGFGGKHTSEVALEAARIARAVGKPVWMRWTREEEFTWAYFRPAAVIECRGGLGADHSIVAWDFSNINGGRAGIDTPYDIPNARITSIRSDSPLRQGSYRCLGATGSNFARESFMDELAAASSSDPLEFRLDHLKNERLRKVLQTAAEHFGWSDRKKKVSSELGVGLACGTEKNSCVAACVEVSIDRRTGRIRVLEVCQAFECGPILNPDNLRAQVQGCISMGLGGALFEEIEFESGKILNGTFARYRVPRFRDQPKIDLHLVNNTRIPSAGAGETPILAIAPAIGNAVFASTGVRLRSMPISGEALRKG